ncbi:MAG: hypothetical protein JWO97_3891 [Acidobacteria bacterium]|nr:hypothetical protein [Acidobacteriota bacterium]
MRQSLRDLYDDIEPALRLFRLTREIQSRIMSNYAECFDPLRIVLPSELRAALEKEIAEEAYDLCAFIQACLEEHPELYRDSQPPDADLRV